MAGGTAGAPCRTDAGQGRVRAAALGPDPAARRAAILRAATAEFAAHGLAGARLDRIARHAVCSPTAIRRQFGGKEALYREALADAYRRARAGELALDLEHLTPVEAIRRLVEFTFDHHRRNVAFIRLAAGENFHEARHLSPADDVRALSAAAVERVAAIYRRGVAAGLFRPGLAPVELHWMISALSVFNVAHQATFALLFGDALSRPEGQAALREDAVEMVLRFLMRDPPLPGDPARSP